MGLKQQVVGKTWEQEIIDAYYDKGWQPFKIPTEIKDELNHFVSHCRTNVYIFVKSDKTGCFWTSWVEAKNHFLKKGYICKEDCIDMGGMLE